ncbi:MAG: CocE/NonD family hydrolase [Candidatus Omnitrophota bacterium]|nr:CocE/NonD family hydrolase [Candidatus Omnitrophota bacterium]
MNIKSFAHRLLSCLILSLLLSGCAVWRPFSANTINATPELSEEYREYYDYPTPDLDGRLVFEEEKTYYTLRRYEIPLTLPESLQHDSPASLKQAAEKKAETDQKNARDLELRYLTRIDYYLPKNLQPGQRRPAILISPILGGNMVVDRFANYYAGRGFVVVLAHRKKTFWVDGRGIQQVEDYMRTSVIRLRQAVDWLMIQPEVDPDRIGAFGISYGAVLHTVLAAVEPRLKYHVLAMPGGPLPEVIRDCPDGNITKLWRNAQRDTGWPDEKILEELRRVLKTDPILLAPYVPREKVQVYVAIFDRVVGAGRSWGLWKALGKPDLKIMPFGHYGGVLVFPFLQSQSAWNLKRHLGQARQN